MILNKNDYSKYVIVMLLFGSLSLGTAAYAANDPSIKGDVRKNIVLSMKEFIDGNTIGDSYHLFDAVEGNMLRLKFKKLHDGVVKKGDYYVSCADFVDQDGRTVDIDFLVLNDGNGFKTTQGVVHSIDGEKRKYHLE